MRMKDLMEDLVVHQSVGQIEEVQRLAVVPSSQAADLAYEKRAPMDLKAWVGPVSTGEVQYCQSLAYPVEASIHHLPYPV
jgi:hypothetical protein